MAETKTKQACNEAEPTFEQSLVELESIVKAVEEGRIGLQDAIGQYEKGMQLVQRCRQMLSAAETKISKLQLNAENELERTPMKMPEE